jgi:uncharacterized protein (DUF305 family)
MKRLIPALLAAALLVLAGCGTGAATTSRPRPSERSTVSPAFNGTDVMFAHMMLAYQGQSRKLVPLAANRAQRPEVRTLAAAIDVTQADEAETLLKWLRAWGQPITADQNPDAHAGHGGLHDLSAAEVAELEKASGTDFDRKFLNLLIGQQHNMVEVARMETADGVNPEAKDLAHRVEQSRSAQIQQMLTMVNG